jgi:hypothetical protein
MAGISERGAPVHLALPRPIPQVPGRPAKERAAPPVLAEEARWAGLDPWPAAWLVQLPDLVTEPFE